jgi:hypothetical protein
MEFMRREHVLRRTMKGLAGAPRLVPAAAAAALICTAAAAAPASSPASCREAANGLISLLDAGKDTGALYRDTYAVVVNTCGPAATAPHAAAAPPSPSDRAKCHDLAAALVDLIEDDAMDSAKFAATRDTFAAACAPK